MIRRVRTLSMTYGTRISTGRSGRVLSGFATGSNGKTRGRGPSDWTSPYGERWRLRHDPAQVDNERRRRESETEVDRLERLVAELMLDQQMLQDIAKKKW
jgi:hypothetical protein